MIMVKVIPSIANLDNPEALSEEVKNAKAGTIEFIAGVPNGMESGAPSVVVLAKTDSGELVSLQLSLKLFLAAGEAIEGATVT